MAMALKTLTFEFLEICTQNDFVQHVVGAACFDDIKKPP